jgi:hypothetical protein
MARPSVGSGFPSPQLPVIATTKHTKSNAAILDSSLREQKKYFFVILYGFFNHFTYEQMVH